MKEDTALSQIEKSLQAAASVPAKAETVNYIKRLSSVIAESGLDGIRIDRSKKWLYDRTTPKALTKDWVVDIMFTTGMNGSRPYGFLHDEGWASPLIQAFYERRKRHHYTIARDKLLLVANISSAQ